MGDKLIWKKQGVEVAYTHMKNKAFESKRGGTGWSELDLEPLIEGKYRATTEAIETLGNQQVIGGAALDFEVAEKLKIRFFRTAFEKGVWKKKDEIAEGKIITGDNVMVEYDGPFYDDFVWFIDKQRWEGNKPRLIFAVDKIDPSSYLFKLIAASRNRKSVAEDKVNLEVVSPQVRIRTDGEVKKQGAGKDSFIYWVPYNSQIEFVASREPQGSSFSSRNDLKYLWIFNEGKKEEGTGSYKLTFSEEKHPVAIPHTLSVSVYSNDKKVVAKDKITIIPTTNSAAKSIGQNEERGFAFAYLNIPERFKFTLQTILWVCFLYLLLASISWLSRSGEKK
jgi:hypothetical protein